MTDQKITIISKPRRLFEVSYVYTDGVYEYCEKLFLHGSRDQLEEEVRETLRDFADEGTEIIWTFEEQDATNESRSVSGYPRYLEASAREIDSLEDLECWDL